MTPSQSLTAVSMLFILICSLKTEAQNANPDSGSSVCPLEYTEQPPDQLFCNPYLNAQLRLECTVIAQTQLSQIPKIVWYRSQYSTPQQSPSQQREESHSQSQSKRNAGGQWVTQRLDTTQADVLIRSQSSTSGSTGFYSVRSRLQISNLDASDSGEYRCAVELDGQELDVSSDALFLREPAFYSQISTACSTTGALSKDERKCAVSMASIRTNTAQSTTLVSNAITTVPTSSEKPSPSSATGDDSKPTTSSSIPNSRNTEGMPNPLDNQHTTSGLMNDLSSSSISVEGENSTSSDSNTNPNVLLELYIAVAILVIFGVIIIILVPVTVWMCLKKRKNRRIEGMRRARQNLELASARCNVQTTTTQINIASDYLIPMPSWRSHRGKPHTRIQPVDCSSTNFLHRSYEATLSCSHEYEDVMDVATMEEGNTHHEVYTSGSSPTSISSGVLEDVSPPPLPSTGAYINERPVMMKRNAAYRMFSTEECRESVRRHPYCNDVTVPPPVAMDSLHTQTEQSSNLE